MTSLLNLARVLGGDVVGMQVLCPGPGHGSKDRSLAVMPSVGAPDGFVVHSHAGDDFRACRDHVLTRLGIAPESRDGRRDATPRSGPVMDDDATAKAARARAVWDQGADPRGTVVERYLASRMLDLPVHIAGSVIRFHPACPWREDDGTVVRVPAMLAPFRDLRTEKIVGVHRTRLTTDGAKVARKMQGVARHAAIMIDADVTYGLTLGEGIETSIAARQIGLRPVWAMGSVGAIANFPVLSGIDALTLLAETDATGANARATDACGARWADAGREVIVAAALAGGDINDAVRGRVA